MKTTNVVALLSATAITLAWGCSTGEERLGIENEQPAGSFVNADSGSDADADPNALVTYCPSSECPPGWTTCPNSRFPCDVNLLSDPKNCGACGAACPSYAGAETFTCAEGTCAMQCYGNLRFDCDGLPDNGCEVNGLDNFNCGACGNKCPDDKRCLFQDESNENAGCGCPPGKVDCAGCKDLSSNDSSCGACGNSCDPTGGPGAPQYPNVYYGCSESTCKAKCKRYFQNCDKDNENGCEASLVTDENCGGCGNACPAGQHCNLNGQQMPECMCSGDLTFCSDGTYEGHPLGHCADVSSDPINCGACGVSCIVSGGPPPYTRRTCDFGQCVSRCVQDHADCNGNEADGCEIDTRSDPRNCGGCGIVCNAVAGQACVAGQCVVEPCDQVDGGEVTR